MPEVLCIGKYGMAPKEIVAVLVISIVFFIQSFFNHYNKSNLFQKVSFRLFFLTCPGLLSNWRPRYCSV